MEVDPAPREIANKLKSIKDSFDEVLRNAGDILAHFNRSYASAGEVQLFPSAPELLTARLGKSMQKIENKIDNLIESIVSFGLTELTCKG
jgi:hypothetical protein